MEFLTWLGVLMVALVPVGMFMHWVDDEMHCCVSALVQLIVFVGVLAAVIWLVDTHG